MNEHMSVAPGSTVTWQHSTYKILLTAEATGGAVGMFEALAAPDAGPPRHVHHNEDETFYILAGEAIFWLDGETRNVGPGDVVFAPRKRPHTFHVIGPNPARWITVLTPGGTEGFFVEMAAGNYRIPQDIAEVSRIAANYGNEFVGPPLKAREGAV
jgi:mannose-6-phosphate isomerase-like protein (cupin superfamily)